MAFSYVNYTGDGTTTQFSITFTYQNTSEISVTVDGVAQAGLTFPSSSTVQLTSAPASSTIVQVRRTTSLTERAVDFASGSVLTEEDLDNSAIQTFHAAQEATDRVADAIYQDTDLNWTAQNKRIKNVANPTAAQDAVTKNYLENTWLSAADKAQLNALNLSNLNTVANNIGNVNTVAGNNTNINTVAGISGNVTTVAGISSSVTAVAADATDIGTVATNIANVNSVAGNSANITSVAGNATNINTVAADGADIGTVAGSITNVNTVVGNITNVNTVAGNIANINAVAANETNINTVATGLANNTVVTVDGTQTLTNKSIDLTDNTLTGTVAEFNAAVTDATFVTTTGTETLTNKTINLANNTLVMTSAQLSAAITDETGTSNIVFSDSPALTGTPTVPTAAAGTNTTQIASTAHVLAERTNTATLTNKTLTSPTINTATISGGNIDNAVIGNNTPRLGSFTTINMNNGKITNLDAPIATTDAVNKGYLTDILDTWAITNPDSIATQTFNVDFDCLGLFISGAVFSNENIVSPRVDLSRDFGTLDMGTL